MKSALSYGSQAIRQSFALTVGALMCATIAGATPQAIYYPASVSSSGQFSFNGGLSSSISADARHVVFSSYSSNLTLGNTNMLSTIFSHDLHTGRTRRVSRGLNGVGPSDGPSFDPDVSGDGRFVVFRSGATDLVQGDTNDREDVFIRDMLLGVTERLSVTSTGAEAIGHSRFARITADSRYVVFDTTARLTPNDTDFERDVYRVDRQLDLIEVVSALP